MTTSMRSPLLLLWLSLTVLGAACGCGPKKPAVETLKKEGEPCSADDRCETGLCDGVTQAVCVRKCAVGCNAEEVCTQLTPGRFSCQPDQRRLCQSCLLDSDCPYPADKCIVVNSEKVCGRDCAFDQNCPSGYVCVNARGSDGNAKVQQCSPMVASCACLARGDLMQPCVNVNDAGTCFGVKTCDLVNNGVSCNARTPELETCNGLDDDCDGETDEGAGTISCGVGACLRSANSCVDGGTGTCTPGMPITELCNNVDDDCDGTVDNGFPIDNDVNNCGGCGVRCNLPHATSTCSMRTCHVDTCDLGWANCDRMDPNGCEVETASNAMHCGGCNRPCARPNSTATCVNSSCQYQCAPNFWDLDGDPSNGCEYACTFMSSTDLPDLGFVDANCDGIDGEVMRGIFVSTTGADSNPGTKAMPKQTLAAAVTALVTSGKRDLYLSAGTYTGPLALLGVSGVNVAGAYHPMTWQRALTNQVNVNGGAKALEIEGASNVLVQALRFQGGLGAPTAYGGWVKESQNVRLESLELRAGNGANGQDGADGSPGTPGDPGGPGRQGCSRDITGIGGACLLAFGFCSNPSAGTGGASGCGFPGGNGGSPTFGPSAPPGTVGSNAPMGTGTGGQGVGGQIGRGPGPNTSNGTVGAPGTSGTNGAGATTAGGFSMNGFAGSSGSPGTAGTPGKGGGGGGGGCGGQMVLDASNTCNAYGSGGGGGGGGGCGGARGEGGLPGGASIGLFLFNANVSAQGVVAVAGNGGAGGRGGQGGALGMGGGGGASPYGGNTPFSGTGQGNACVGGVGGAGGSGGAGGHGGGGSGGSVYGLVKNATSMWNPISGTSFMVGSIGAAGTSPGNAGVPGVSGIQLTF